MRRRHIISLPDRPRWPRRLAAVLPSVALAALVQGCVSTEALYAEYDERDCRVVVAVPPEDARAGDAVGARALLWEPLVRFANGSDALAANEKRRLDRDVAVLRAHPQLRVRLRGLTDASGSVAVNRALAARRVRSVMDHLGSRGIDRQRLAEAPPDTRSSLPRGQGRAIVALDRRVELLLLDADGVPLPLRVPPDAVEGTGGAEATRDVGDEKAER